MSRSLPEMGDWDGVFDETYLQTYRPVRRPRSGRGPRRSERPSSARVEPAPRSSTARRASVDTRSSSPRRAIGSRAWIAPPTLLAEAEIETRSCRVASAGPGRLPRAPVRRRELRRSAQPLLVARLPRARRGRRRAPRVPARAAARADARHGDGAPRRLRAHRPAVRDAGRGSGCRTAPSTSRNARPTGPHGTIDTYRLIVSADGERIERPYRLHVYSAKEWAEMLREAGFAEIDAFGGWDEPRPPTPDAWRLDPARPLRSDGLGSRPMRVQFDRFYTYAELTETLDAWAGEHPAAVRASSRSGTPTRGATSGSCTVTNRETGPPEEKPAVFVHAQIHAMEFTGTTAALNLLDHLLHSGRRARRATPSTRARSTSSRASTPTAPRRGSPTGASAARASGRIRARSPRTGSSARTSTATGASSSCGCAIRTARGSRIPDDPRALIARAPDDVEGEFYRVLPEGTIRELGRRDDPDRARRSRGSTSTATGRPSGLPRPSSRAPGRSRPRSPRSARSSRRSSRGRTSRRTSATTRSRGVHLRPWSGHSGRRLPGPRPARVRAHGRGGDAPHRLPVDLDLPRLQVPPEAGHQGRRRRLGLRPPRRVRVGDRVLEPAACAQASPTTT